MEAAAARKGQSWPLKKREEEEERAVNGIKAVRKEGQSDYGDDQQVEKEEEGEEERKCVYIG